MDFVDSGVTGTYGAGQRVRERRTFEHARTRPTHPSRHGHAHTVNGGCARDHPPLHPRPCDANANDRDPRSRRPPHVRQPSRSPSKGRSQCHPKPILGRHLASARATEEQPAHGTEYGPPWVEMERPSQPNVAQVDGSRMRTRVRQLHRKENAVHEVAPSCAPASRATCACRTRPRHSTTARSNGSNHAPTAWPGRQPPTHDGVSTRAPPFTRMDGQRPPEHSRVPRPTCYREARVRLFWWWCQPGPTRYRYNA